MAAPLSMSSGAVSVSSVWRAISGLRFFRRLLGTPEARRARASATPAVGPHLGTCDWDGPDTSLTQAELEVLK